MMLPEDYYGMAFRILNWKNGLVDRRITSNGEEGIIFSCNANVGVDMSINELMREYHAIVLSWRIYNPKGSNYSRQGSKRNLFRDGFFKTAK